MKKMDITKKMDQSSVAFNDYDREVIGRFMSNKKIMRFGEAVRRLTRSSPDYKEAERDK